MPSDSHILREWLALPARLESAVRGLRGAQLDASIDPQAFSVRKTVHHLVESNLIASNILLAALATDGGPFDSTWVSIDGAWMKRMGYDRLPVEAAIELLRALVRHFKVLIDANPGAMRREVTLFDSPDGKPCLRTVKGVLAMELAHATVQLAFLPKRGVAPGGRSARRRRRPSSRKAN